MSSVGTTPTNQPFQSDRPPLKRKLEDYDSPVSQFCKNSNTNCKEKAVTHDDHLEYGLPKGNNFFFRGESNGINCDLMGSHQLQFFVKLISGGNSLILRANLDDTVELVHEKIQNVTGIPSSVQRLIFQGKQLQREQTLKQCNIQNDAGLQMVGRMRSARHPQAWVVIGGMIHDIGSSCRNINKNYVTYYTNKIKSQMKGFMTLSLDNRYHPANNGKKRDVRKIKGTNNGDDDEEEEEENYDDDYNNRSIDKCDYCEIFLTSCAPQSLVMLYASNERANQECAEECIRSFVNFMKSLKGTESERAYCAKTVLVFCELLRKLATEDDLLYIHCRSTLGSMLVNVVVTNVFKEVYGHDGSEELYGIPIGAVFPLLKEVGERLVQDLKLNVVSDSSLGPLHRDVLDFSNFLQPVLTFIGREQAYRAKGEINLFDDLLNNLYNDLHGWIDKCLKKVELCLGVKGKKFVEANLLGWSQYLAILKELHSISLLNPESEGHLWTTLRQSKTALCGLIVRYARRVDDHSWLLKHKDDLDFQSRRHLVSLLFPEVREDYDELLEMLIDRSNLLAESFEYISTAIPSILQAGLFMEFKNEEATGPGVLREWFCLVCQAIFDPERALFASCPLDRRRFFPSQASKVHPLHLRYFLFSGRVIALALKHKIQVGVVLDRIFFLQLAGRQVSIEDIQAADPCIYSSCKQILEMDADFVDSDGLGLTFSIDIEELGKRNVVELCPGGKDISVNSKNRKEYVDLIVQHHFVSSISEQVSYFAQGFADILSEANLRETFFKSLELEDLDWMLHGSESEICVEDWKSHTDYYAYKKSDPQIKWFWEVVGQFNAEQKKTLLFFWTSIKYLPIEGFRGLSSRLCIYKSLDSQNCLPSSHTCFFRICIPPYPTKTIMRQRLLLITQEHIGCSFGTW
ncbi:E3 ubiquitin-protein ligase UPL5-like [Chenopodium quinoa]|uniref:E3 ubiquitin-protein ligase UPL5-like n=1 Tax=Chenopodium quinoa TaxID=63459 RepID=UPI000B77DAB7|nr:E3 ubiquitin-protein ligase UPL5-like [Chenopodium quinoa]